MTDKNNSVLSSVLLGAFIAVGLSLGAFFVANAVKNFRLSGRYVTVKGLAERDVVADVAIWKIRFKASSNDLAVANTKALSDISTITNFLTSNGVKADEIETSAPRVIDLFAREWGPEHAPLNRYIIEAMVSVKSRDVGIIENAARKAIELIKTGIVLDENTFGANPAYIFTKLNELRPTMLAEATKSARALAEQFAADSGSKVGPIRVANQGVFTIGSDIQSDEGGAQENLTPKKRVRVVSTIDYFLVD